MTDNVVTVIVSGHEMVTILKLLPVKIIYGCQTTNNHEQGLVLLLWYTGQLTCIMRVTHLQIENVNLMLKGQFHIHYSQIQAKCSVTISNE